MKLVFLCISFLSAPVLAQVKSNLDAHSYLHFDFNVDTAFVQLGKKYPKIYRIADGDTLTVKSGFHHIYFSYPTNNDFYFNGIFKEDSVYTFKHNFDLSKKEIKIGSNNASISYLLGGDFLILTDHDTKISFNGDPKGQEFGIFNLNKSNNTITLSNDRYYSVNLDANKQETIQYKTYFFYPSTSSWDSFIPGIYQIKNQQYFKSALIFGTILASSTFFLKFHNEYRSNLSAYNKIRTNYLDADRENLALMLGDRMEKDAVRLDKINMKRNLALFGLLGAVAYDFFDKLRMRKKLGIRKRKNIEMFLKPKFHRYLSVGAKISF